MATFVENESVSPPLRLTPFLIFTNSLHLLRPTESTIHQSSATKYLREGNLTWQDEFDGIEIDGASDGVMGLEYWWQHEEVLSYSQRISRYIPYGTLVSVSL